MSDILSRSLQFRINRTLEYAVYSKALEEGYTPDRKAFLGNDAGYAAKQAEIKKRKGFCFDIYGHGASMDRRNKFVPRIVITGLGFLPGSVGNDKIPFYVKNGQGKYSKYLGPSRSANYRFEIELVSNKTNQDMVAEGIRGAALPDLTYLPLFDSPQDSILLQYGQMRQMPDYNHGLIQRIYTYEILDVFETLPVLVSREIARLKQITITDTTDNTTILGIPNSSRSFDDSFDQSFK